MHEVYGRPTVAEVSLSALRANCRQVREIVGPCVAVQAVVKADAYGHGAVAAARAFVEAGAASLGVSSVAEGMQLRLAGLTVPIVVLGGCFAGEEAQAVGHDLACAVWTVDTARALAAAARSVGRTALLHVKIDTGMTRLGLNVRDVRAFGEAVRPLAGARVVGVFSHFASADDLDTAVARAQTDRFRQATEELAAVGIRPEVVHLANSAAVFSVPTAHFTMVRPGISLYGYPPAAHLGARVRLVPAMRLRTSVVQARDVPALTPVGYGGTFVTAKPSRIAVLPLGYADGYHRLASNRASVLVRRRRVPVAGRICMDHTMVDTTEVAGVEAGEPVVVFGPQGGALIGADELAAWCDTIPYEVLTSIGRRVPRVYVEDFSDG
jgi:alanine racemase